MFSPLYWVAFHFHQLSPSFSHTDTHPHARAQTALETRLSKEVRKVRATLQQAEESNAELLAENTRLKEALMHAQQQQQHSKQSGNFGAFVEKKRDAISAAAAPAPIPAPPAAAPAPAPPAPAPRPSAPNFGAFVDARREILAGGGRDSNSGGSGGGGGGMGGLLALSTPSGGGRASASVLPPPAARR
jgi:hypothetical protein